MNTNTDSDKNQSDPACDSFYSCSFVSIRGFRSALNLAAAFERAAEREFVGEFEPASNRQTVRDAGHVNAPRGKNLIEVKARRFAFDIGGQRDDNLLDAFALAALFEFGNAQVLGFHA